MSNIMFFCFAASVRPENYAQIMVYKVSSGLLSVVQDEINDGEEEHTLRALLVLPFPCDSQAGRLFQLLCDYHAGDSIYEFIDFVEEMLRQAFIAGMDLGPNWKRALSGTE